MDDDIPSNQLLDDLPTQNEIIQNNNGETVSNYNPPPIYDNNIPQEVIQNNNNNNNQIPINYIAPPIYDNNNTPQEYTKP